MKEFKCKQCDEPCDVEKERIDYSGTHCNNGRSGTWVSGYYVSECCGADYKDNNGEENE